MCVSSAGAAKTGPKVSIRTQHTDQGTLATIVVNGLPASARWVTTDWGDNGLQVRARRGGATLRVLIRDYNDAFRDSAVPGTVAHCPGNERQVAVSMVTPALLRTAVHDPVESMQTCRLAIKVYEPANDAPTTTRTIQLPLPLASSQPTVSPETLPPLTSAPHGRLLLASNSGALFILDPNVARPRAAPFARFDGDMPTFADDGKSVVFQSQRPGSMGTCTVGNVTARCPDVWFSQLETGATANVTHSFDFEYWPSLSHDARTIVYSRGWSPTHLCTVRIDGSENRCVTSGKFSDLHAVFSKDDRWLAFERQPALDAGQFGEVPNHLYVMPTAGGTPRKLDKRPAQSAAWSPDGRHLAYNVMSPEHNDAGPIVIANADGSAKRALTGAVSAYRLYWSADGARLYFFDFDNGVFKVDATTGRVTRLVRGFDEGTYVP
jgi:hypothetical protein